MCNASAFEEYVQDNKSSIQKLFSLIDNENNSDEIEIQKLKELKKIIGSEDILETISFAREALEKESWYEASDLLYKIAHEIERANVSDKSFADSYTRLIEDIERISCIHEDACRIIVFSHFETIYYNLSDDEKCKKLEEYLDNIEKNDEWNPGYWLIQTWSVYKYHFCFKQEFIKIQKCFSVFGKISWYEMDEVIWDNSIAVLKDMLKHNMEADYLSGVKLLDTYSDKVPDIKIIEWLNYRYLNYLYDPLSIEELSKRMYELTNEKVEQILSDLENYDIINDSYQQKELEKENLEMITIIGILKKLKMEISNEYKEKVCEVLSSKESKVIPEGKEWYKNMLKKWKEI